MTQARQVDPDVIVLDLGTPGLDGVEVSREVRTFSDAYVVMLTARSEVLGARTPRNRIQPHERPCPTYET